MNNYREELVNKISRDNMNVDKILKSKILLWISSPHIYAGFSEKEFKGLIGYEKYSAHLSYFYGIIIERCLLCFVEQELIKRQASYGNFVRFNPDDAFQKIYEFSFTEMFNALANFFIFLFTPHHPLQAYMFLFLQDKIYYLELEHYLAYH